MPSHCPPFLPPRVSRCSPRCPRRDSRADARRRQSVFATAPAVRDLAVRRLSARFVPDAHQALSSSRRDSRRCGESALKVNGSLHANALTIVVFPVSRRADDACQRPPRRPRSLLEAQAHGSTSSGRPLRHVARMPARSCSRPSSPATLRARLPERPRAGAGGESQTLTAARLLRPSGPRPPRTRPGGNRDPPRPTTPRDYDHSPQPSRDQSPNRRRVAAPPRDGPRHSRRRPHGKPAHRTSTWPHHRPVASSHPGAPKDRLDKPLTDLATRC